MSRVLQDFAAGQLSSGVNAGATTLSSPGFSSLPEITGSDYTYIVIDPEGTGNGPEKVKVTAHSSGSPDVTCEALSASHSAGTKWVLPLLTEDIENIHDEIGEVADDLSSFQSTASGQISALESAMSTAQGNITSLQNAVTALQNNGAPADYAHLEYRFSDLGPSGTALTLCTAELTPTESGRTWLVFGRANWIATGGTSNARVVLQLVDQSGWQLAGLFYPVHDGVTTGGQIVAFWQPGQGFDRSISLVLAPVSGPTITTALSLNNPAQLVLVRVA